MMYPIHLKYELGGEKVTFSVPRDGAGVIFEPSLEDARRVINEHADPPTRRFLLSLIDGEDLCQRLSAIDPEKIERLHHVDPEIENLIRWIADRRKAVLSR